MEYAIYLATLVCLYCLLAQSFNLVFGLGKLLNLAHIASYAIGAYTTALLSTDLGWGFFACLALSAILTGFFALLIGAISLRLEHDYFAIGTLAFSAVVTAILINWKELTRGVLGIPGIPRPDFWGIDFYNNLNFLTLLFIITVISMLIVWLLFKSRIGFALRAQSESESAVKALGISVLAVRNDAFILASMLAGVAGCLFAYLLNYIDPSSFGLHEMVFILSIVVLGKPGSFFGCIFATIFLVLLPEPLRFLDLPSHYLGPLRQLIYAVILFVVLYIRRTTLFPVERKV
jgi:branched-chain amino acid transport system permease protein